jgi:hypothetical protein
MDRLQSSKQALLERVNVFRRKWHKKGSHDGDDGDADADDNDEGAGARERFGRGEEWKALMSMLYAMTNDEKIDLQPPIVLSDGDDDDDDDDDNPIDVAKDDDDDDDDEGSNETHVRARDDRQGHVHVFDARACKIASMSAAALFVKTTLHADT